MADKGKGIPYRDGVIALTFFMSLLGKRCPVRLLGTRRALLARRRQNGRRRTDNKRNILTALTHRQRPSLPFFAGLVFVYRVFMTFYDYKKFLWRRKKYAGAQEYAHPEWGLMTFIKTLGRGNTTHHRTSQFIKRRGFMFLLLRRTHFL